ADFGLCIRYARGKRGTKLLSINVGLPREIEWKRKVVRTSIFKEPVTGRIRVTRLNVNGDQQSDLTVHEESIRRFTLIHQNVTCSGAGSFLARTSRREFSARTSQRRACLSKRFVLVIAFASGLQNSW